MTATAVESLIKKKYQDLCLDLNLDKAAADDAWESYEKIKTSYSLEGDQLPWLACALYSSCRKRSIPTVGGRPGNMIQGNCVSLTRMLQHCSLPLTDFIMKMKSWLAMSHCDETFCSRIDLLERNFAVSSNIFKTYKPIFLDLFQDPSKDLPRPPRSRKQRRPLCNATELFNFCWTLYICIKGKYPSIPQDLVSCFSLLLSCIDLMYTNVILSNRKDLLSPSCEGLPPGILEQESAIDLASYPVSIMDYLCKKFDCVVLETKVVRDYYWKPNIEDLVQRGVLKGTKEGTGFLEQTNFDHNVKEIKNGYEEYLLSCGEFDERMFLNDPTMVKGMSRVSSPDFKTQDSSKCSTISNNNTPLKSVRCNLSQTFDGDRSDHHLVPQTPITGRQYTVNRPVVGNTPLTVITTGLHKLYALISGRKNSPGEKLQEIFRSIENNPEERISHLVSEMSENFMKLYSQATEDYTAPNVEFTKMRLQTGQILYYTFLEHILVDEQKRKVDLQAILKEDLFHRTLFTCCIEIVLKSYNDARRFPWSLQVGKVDPYYFKRIIEPVIRSEKQSENQLSRELVKHLKGIEEQILDSLAWQRDSPLWQILKDTDGGVPSCQDVNFSNQLAMGLPATTPSPSLPSSSIMSPAIKIHKDVPQSPLSSIQERINSPNSCARRMLFPTATSMGPSNITDQLKLLQPKTLKPMQPVSVAEATQDQQSAAREATVDSFLQSPSPIQASSEAQPARKDKPRRHGSLALFFRKFYTLADMRLRDLCDRLDIRSAELRQQIWTCFEHSIIHYTEMMADRHMDQMVMCAVYITCKVTGSDKIFQEIMKHYRNQPQAASHVYRSVLISRNCSKNSENECPELQKQVCGPPQTPSQMRGTSANMPSGERGDLIAFYNTIYVKTLRNFALKFRKEQGDVVSLSPLPVVRTTPVSPRRRISNHHSVYINSLNSNTPMKGSNTLSPRPPLPYYFNRSPAKDLRVINSMVKSQCTGNKRLIVNGGQVEVCESFGGVNKRMRGVLEHHQPALSPSLSSSSSLEQPLLFSTTASVESSRGQVTVEENGICLQIKAEDNLTRSTS